MANAILIPAEPVEQNVQLTLTGYEASVLHRVAGRIGGRVGGGPRSAMDRIRQALGGVHVPLWNAGEMRGIIDFKD